MSYLSVLAVACVLTYVLMPAVMAVHGLGRRRGRELQLRESAAAALAGEETLACPNCGEPEVSYYLRGTDPLPETQIVRCADCGRSRAAVLMEMPR